MSVVTSRNIALLLALASVATSACGGSETGGKGLVVGADGGGASGSGGTGTTGGASAGGACTMDQQCRFPRPYCDVNGTRFCVECTSDIGCVGNPDGTVCDLTSHTCVWCASDTQCESRVGLPRCSTRWHTCVECLVATDCAAPGSTCNPDTNRCVPTCTTTGECSATISTPLCDTAAGFCVECLSSSDCAGNPNGNICLGHVCQPCVC